MDSINRTFNTDDYFDLTLKMCKKTQILNNPAKGGSVSSSVINDESVNLLNIHQRHMSYLAIFIIVAIIVYTNIF